MTTRRGALQFGRGELALDLPAEHLTVVVFMGDNGMALTHGKGALHDP